MTSDGFGLLLLSTVRTDKSKMEIAQNIVAFSGYMNFITSISYLNITEAAERPKSWGRH